LISLFFVCPSPSHSPSVSSIHVVEPKTGKHYMPIQSVCVYGTRVVDSTSMNKTLRLLKKVQKIEDVCDDPKRTMLTRPVTNDFFFPVTWTSDPYFYSRRDFLECDLQTADVLVVSRGRSACRHPYGNMYHCTRIRRTGFSFFSPEITPTFGDGFFYRIKRYRSK
jgi:hypothetical protein